MHIFVNSIEEAKFAPLSVKSMTKTNQSEIVACKMKQLTYTLQEMLESNNPRRVRSDLKKREISYKMNLNLMMYKISHG